MFNIFNLTLPCTVSVLIVASQREGNIPEIVLYKMIMNVDQLATNQAFPLYLAVSMNSPTFTIFSKAMMHRLGSIKRGLLSYMVPYCNG